jgi:trans-aconitate methyltransferase
MDQHDDWAARVAHLEQEAEALLEVVTVAAASAGERCGSVRRIVDLGSGPGVGTCELARLFPDAEVVAVDGSEPMLLRAAERARSLGFADRVTTHLAHLPDGIADLEPADLVFASMVLHHAPDAAGVLRAVARSLVTSESILVVVEHGPGPLGHHVPVVDLGPALSAAMFDVIEERVHLGRLIVTARLQR